MTDAPILAVVSDDGFTQQEQALLQTASNLMKLFVPYNVQVTPDQVVEIWNGFAWMMFDTPSDAAMSFGKVLTAMDKAMGETRARLAAGADKQDTKQ